MHEQGLATMHHVYTPPQHTRQGYVSPSLRNRFCMHFWSSNLVPVIESPSLSSNPPTSSDLPSAVSLTCFAFPSLTHSVYLGELLHNGLSERHRCEVGAWYRCADEAFIHCLLLPCMILGQLCFSVFSPLTSTYLIVIQLQITSIKFYSLISINFIFESSVISYHLSVFTFCDLFYLGFKTKLWLGNEWRDRPIAFSGSNDWTHHYWWKPLHLRWKRQIWSELSLTSIIRSSDLVYFLTDVRWQWKFKVNYLV